MIFFRQIQQRETVHDVQWTSALHGPERSGETRMSESGRTQPLKIRYLSRHPSVNHQGARRCTTSGGRRLCTDRSGAEKFECPSPVGLSCQKLGISYDTFPSNPAARDGARRPVDVGSARTEAERRNSNVRVRQDSFITKRTSIGCPFCYKESARRDSNPRPRPWQGRAPPTEPLAHKYLCAKYI